MSEIRPRLRRSVDPRLTPDGTLYVLRGHDQADLELAGHAELLAQLLHLADGTQAADALVSQLTGTAKDAEDLAAAIEALLAEGVLDDAAMESELLAGCDSPRFERQLAYFADMLGSARAAAAAQRALRDASVCLLGLGGLGAWAAWGIASAGVGEIVGVDCDVVEPSNLNRQILYTEADIGAPKTAAAGRRLRAFRSALRYGPIDRRLDSADAVRQAIRGSDFVVDSLDSPPGKITRWVAEACFAEAIPYLALSQHPPMLRVGPLYVPGTTGCFACQEARYRRDYPLYSTLEDSTQIRAPSATFGPACGVVGTLAANEVTAWLTGLHPPTCLGSAALIDLRTLEIQREPIGREPRCVVCG